MAIAATTSLIALHTISMLQLTDDLMQSIKKFIVQVKDVGGVGEQISASQSSTGRRQSAGGEVLGAAVHLWE